VMLGGGGGDVLSDLVDVAAAVAAVPTSLSLSLSCRCLSSILL